MDQVTIALREKLIARNFSFRCSTFNLFLVRFNFIDKGKANSLFKQKIQKRICLFFPSKIKTLSNEPILPNFDDFIKKMSIKKIHGKQ